MAEDPHFKIHPETIKFAPGLNIQVGPTKTNIPAPDDKSLEPHVPAVTPTGIRQRAQRIAPRQLRRQAGATLEEQMGGRPKEMVEESERIVPTISRADADTPFFQTQTTPVPAVQPIDAPEVRLIEPSGPVEDKVDLRKVVTAAIDKMGFEEAEKFFDTKQLTLKRWLSGLSIPLDALQRILDNSPKAKQKFLEIYERIQPIDDKGVAYSVEYTKEELPVDLCLCIEGDIIPTCMWPWITLTLKYGIGVKMLTDIVIPRCRNMVAEMFLSGKAKWSLWLDKDVLPTLGSAPWWQAIVRDPSVTQQTSSYDFLKRLLSHNKPFVGGVYATRRKDGPLVAQPDLHPRNQADKEFSNQVRRNGVRGLYEVDWLANGFALIHRSVFEDVRKRFSDRTPKLTGEPFPFFSIHANEGEDVAFSRTAKECGYKLYLDAELFAAHVGRYPFMPSQTQFNGDVNFVSPPTV